MASFIITLRRSQFFGSDPDEAKVVWTSGTDDVVQMRINSLERAIEWVKQQAGQEWGETIPRVDVFETEAFAGDLNFKMAMAYIATAVRYDTGEKIYKEICPEFAVLGIERS